MPTHEHSERRTVSEQAPPSGAQPSSGGVVAQHPRRRRGRTGRRLGRTIGLPALLFLVVASLWEFLPSLLRVKSFIFPTLSDVLVQFGSGTFRSQLWNNGMVTIEETLLGLLLGSGVGIIAGLLLGESALLRDTFYPYVVGFQSLPKIAIAPLFVIWFGFGITPKVLVAASLAFFPLLVNTMSGVMSVDRDRAQLFRSLSASRRQTWLKLMVPSALPSILAGFEMASILSLLGALLGEFVSSQNGLGVLLLQQQTNYDTAGLFATLIVLSLLGVVFNQIFVQLRKRLVSW